MIRERAQPAPTPGGTRIQGCHRSQGVLQSLHGGSLQEPGNPRVYLSFDTPYIKRNLRHVNSSCQRKIDSPLICIYTHIYWKSLPISIRNNEFVAPLNPDSWNMLLLCEERTGERNESKRTRWWSAKRHAKAERTNVRASIPANYHFSAGRNLSNRADVYRPFDRPSRPSWSIKTPRPRYVEPGISRIARWRRSF